MTSTAAHAPLPTRTGLPALRPLLPWAALLLISLCWDRAVYLHLSVSGDAKHAMEHTWWYWALRKLGELHIWTALAVLLVVLDHQAAGPRRANPLRRGVFLILSVLLAGGLAELLKPLVGRYKPENTDGHFRFASLPDRWYHLSDLGVASSHTAVAFAAAFALSILFPRAALVFLLGAVGCAMTRLLAGAHFLSDVYLAVLLSYAITRLIQRVDARNNPGIPIAT